MDPVRDLAIIHEELRLKDEEFLLKALDTVDKQATRGSGDKMKKLEWVSKQTSHWLYKWPFCEKIEMMVCRDSGNLYPIYPLFPCSDFFCISNVGGGG